MPIYLDYNATTPVDPRVLEKMLPYFTEKFGNASSVDHRHGDEANRAVEEARAQVARAIGAKPEEIVFTSGATESNNLALIGAAEALAENGRHIISSVTEHPAVLDTLEHLQTRGFEVTLVPVHETGLPNLDALREAIRDDTTLISFMAANNEIGTIAPLEKIGEIARDHELVFHTDAAQALAYVDLNVEKHGIHLMSLSGHKCYGPKGVGALYVRQRRPRVSISPILHGGGHERRMRSGTLNVPSIVGFGEAAEIACRERSKEGVRLLALRKILLAAIENAHDKAQANGSLDSRLPGNLNVLLPEVENRALIQLVASDVSIAAGSACSTTEVKPSHVLRAIGRSDTEAHQSIRISVGRFTSSEDASAAGEALRRTIRRLRMFAGGGSLGLKRT